MTIISKQLGLTEITPGMVLSDDLLDHQGQVLLPKGAILTEHTITALHKHDVISLRILIGEQTPEEEATQRAYFAARLERLFRKPETSTANVLLQRYIRTFRLGELT